MFVCHYCHGYADQLEGSIFMFCLTLVQGLARKVPVAKAHLNLNYCFFPYYKNTIQVDIT